MKWVIKKSKEAKTTSSVFFLAELKSYDSTYFLELAGADICFTVMVYKDIYKEQRNILTCTIICSDENPYQWSDYILSIKHKTQLELESQIESCIDNNEGIITRRSTE